MNNKKPERRKIIECLYNNLDFEGPIDNIIVKLQSYKEKHGKEYTEIYLEKNYDDHYYCNCYCGIHKYDLYGSRLQTDEEYNTILLDWEKEKANKRKKARERRKEKLEMERAEYERLKKKFENKK